MRLSSELFAVLLPSWKRVHYALVLLYCCEPGKKVFDLKMCSEGVLALVSKPIPAPGPP